MVINLAFHGSFPMVKNIRFKALHTRLYFKICPPIQFYRCGWKKSSWSQRCPRIDFLRLLTRQEYYACICCDLYFPIIDVIASFILSLQCFDAELKWPLKCMANYSFNYCNRFPNLFRGINHGNKITEKFTV